jgi:hypothetical protein
MVDVIRLEEKYGATLGGPGGLKTQGGLRSLALKSHLATAGKALKARAGRVLRAKNPVKL